MAQDQHLFEAGYSLLAQGALDLGADLAALVRDTQRRHAALTELRAVASELSSLMLPPDQPSIGSLAQSAAQLRAIAIDQAAGLSEVSKRELERLQAVKERIDRFEQTLSNVMAALSQTAQEITQNLK